MGVRLERQMKPSKTYLYDICVGGYYVFKVYKIEDAAHHVYYVGERLTTGPQF